MQASKEQIGLGFVGCKAFPFSSFFRGQVAEPQNIINYRIYRCLDFFFDFLIYFFCMVALGY